MSPVAPAVLRPLGIGREVVAVAMTALAASCVLVAPAQASRPAFPASRPLVALMHDHVARTSPSGEARKIQTVAARRPLTGVRTVLPVLGRAARNGGRSWVQVMLPGGPNGDVGWIRERQTRPRSTEWQISVRLATRQVTVYRDGRPARRFAAVVGKPSTPTPRGRFFIEEALALSAQHAGGPYALATSSRSNVLQEFDGGPGQIALHGTDQLAGALGTAASHGCVRLRTADITWLAQRIGAGVPLTVTR
jgi:lipoprotein-anchoring transpeptidase ErfK/SrfK